MRVTRIKIDTFLLKVARTRETEAGCDDCSKQSARLAEALLQGQVTDGELLDIVHHLLQCLPCSQEFSVLTDCARMDEEDSWPTFEEMWNKIDESK